MKSPINFIVVNGSSWDALAGDARRQSVNMENVAESTCYVMANGTETEGVSDWNKVLTITDCPSTEEPVEPGESITVKVQVPSEGLSSPINFIVVNGSSWDALAGDARRQSVNMENVAESACYVMANGTETEGVSDWNKVLTVTDCPEESAIMEAETERLFTVNGRTLLISLDQEAEVAIYNVNGQLIEHTFTNDYSRFMQQGVYIIRIGNTTEKMVIF